MPKPPSPRPILRRRQDGSGVLRTKNLPQLQTKLGQGVLAAFVCAFLLADRLDGLLTLDRVASRQLPEGSFELRRAHFTFLLLLVGTMKELAEALNQLRAVLGNNNLLEPTEWSSLLGQWDAKWRSDKLVSKVRNSAAFHVDAPLIQSGLSRIPAVTCDIFEVGPPPREGSPDRWDGEFSLGYKALLQGLGLPMTDLVEFFSRPLEDLKVGEHLMTLFISTLSRAGLAPTPEA